MKSFSIQPQKIKLCLTNLENIYRDLSILENEVYGVADSLSDESYHDVKQVLLCNFSHIRNEKNCFQEITATLESCIDLYISAEERIVLSATTSTRNNDFNNDSTDNRTVDVVSADDDTPTVDTSAGETTENWFDKVDNFIESINSVVQQIFSLSSKIQQAIRDATDLDAVVAIGLSGSIGGGAYLGGSVQLVVDMNGNIGLQFCGGTGLEMGASADATAYAAVYPGKENIDDIEGFGAEAGASLGEGIVGSASLLLEGEGNNVSPSGFLIGLGLGGEGTVAEGHTAMSETLPTIKLGNVVTRPIDHLVDNWNIVYKAWNWIK